MAATNTRTPEQVRKDIEGERERLAGAVEHLRGELDAAANVTGKLKSKLPVVAGGAASVGFVLAGGIGATMRYFARRGRDRHEKARVGRWSLRDRH
ncbi:MAG: hypothetical protein M3O89_00445 [Actinomycetota bacterium]|nr:hypothetical protein [Actinomycetota bacterium]